MSIVTKTGDKGQTSLATGERVSKAHRRVDTYGILDELVCFLGLVRSIDIDETIARHIKKIQGDLFLLGAELATSGRRACSANVVAELPPKAEALQLQGKASFATTIIGEDHLKYIENIIDEYEPRLPAQKGFVIPGDSWPSALMDVARAVCRRFERKLIELKETDEFKNEAALKYINRLSDLLYIFARHL